MCFFVSAAAEGCTLKLFSYDELKNSEKRKQPVRISPLSLHDGPKFRSVHGDQWTRGVTLAEGQNYARTLMETPSNLKVPRLLADRIAADLSGQKGLSVTIRDEKWAEEKEMGAFMAVSQGSVEPLRLVEIAYTGRPGSKAVDLAVVGKGVTFDTWALLIFFNRVFVRNPLHEWLFPVCFRGGISIKPSLHMDLMRGTRVLFRLIDWLIDWLICSSFA